MSQDLNRMPPQTKYIVGNEACERFSYYGVISILTGYAGLLYGGTELAKAQGKETVHWFKMACYFTPLLGAWVADRFWGRYRTILWISLAYCIGHAVLSLGDGKMWGLLLGLTFLAIGSGGIKPSVSAFAGDQFAGGREHLIPRIYNWFYWSINFGSAFAFLFIPDIARKYGYGWAFAWPGVAMGVATLIFWLGRRSYIRVPPESASPVHDPAERAADRRLLWKIAGVFSMVPFFWSIFDQQNTTWTQQASQMAPFYVFGVPIDGEKIQSANPFIIMVFVPLFTLLLFPMIQRAGLKLTAVRKMASGFFFAALSFVAAAWLQTRLDAHEQLNVAWQLPQYLLVTAGEVMISITGLQFAFTQAPPRLKSTIMSFWTLTVAAGNGFAATVTHVNTYHVHSTALQELLFYATVVTLAGVAFVFISRKFPTRGE